ncbi:hypothetical protein [Bacillus mesophilum]|uniref:Uncharacterized protein n=1 Tax=Bacillus mesophilum TaxID=1071718 RepID=A0A7V7RI31_9BACI|nr:hypothetical protein [Bacillus mesophilum]KAB2329460.1 hypothetical protein F7732_21280 [Bacillus mesophilum]
MDPKGYEAGKSTSFTPARNANWIDEFNEMLISEDISRNKLTERLIQEALKARKEGGFAKVNQPQTRQASFGGDSITLKCDGFSEEEIRLITSPDFSYVIKNFLHRLLESHEQIGSEVIASTRTNVEKPVVIETDPPLAAESVDKSTEKTQPISEDNQVRRKASAVDALKFVKSIKME